MKSTFSIPSDHQVPPTNLWSFVAIFPKFCTIDEMKRLIRDNKLHFSVKVERLDCLIRESLKEPLNMSRVLALIPALFDEGTRGFIKELTPFEDNMLLLQRILVNDTVKAILQFEKKLRENPQTKPGKSRPRSVCHFAYHSGLKWEVEDVSKHRALHASDKTKRLLAPLFLMSPSSSGYMMFCLACFNGNGQEWNESFKAFVGFCAGTNTQDLTWPAPWLKGEPRRMIQRGLSILHSDLHTHKP